MSLVRLFVLVGSVFLCLTGCASLTTLQTARPIGAGKTQFALEPGAWGISPEDTTNETMAMPRVDISVRHGVSDTVEIGGRLGAGGMELLTKFALTPPDGSVAVALAPSVGGLVGIVPGDGMAFLTIQVPLLIGVPFGNGSELVFGPKIHDVFLGASGAGGVNLFSLGGSVGVSFKVAESFRIFPEFAVVYPLTGSVTSLTGSSSTSDLGNGMFFQAAVGLIFGSAL